MSLKGRTVVPAIILGLVLAGLFAWGATSAGAEIGIPPSPPPPPIRVLGFDYVVGEDSLSLSVQVVLPNPCYRMVERGATLEDGSIILNALLEPPLSGTVCIQVLRTVSLSYRMPLPPPGEYPAYLRLYVKTLRMGIPAIPQDIYLGMVVIPGNTTPPPSPKPAPEATRYQGILLEYVGEWTEVPGYWTYEARVEGWGPVLVALPLQVTGGLPAGFVGLGYADTVGNRTLIVMTQVSVHK